MTAMATAMAVPIGVLLAIFDTEFASQQVSVAIRMTLNVLAGVPTIVIGIFIFGLVVVSRGQSAFAASLALAIIILPVIARATEEVLLLVPSTLREGSMALGATRARTVVSVILPSAFGGIVTATIVGVARAAGETAPILFTSSIFANAVVTDPSQPMASMPFAIFTQLGVAQPARPAGGVGGRAGADGVRAAGQHHRPAAVPADTPPDRADAMTADHSSPNEPRSLTTECTQRIRHHRPMSHDDQQATTPSDLGDEPEVTPAKPQASWPSWPASTSPTPPRAGETVFQLDDVTICYTGKPAICDVDLRHAQEPGDGVHRPLRLRQDHAACAA